MDTLIDNLTGLALNGISANRAGISGPVIEGRGRGGAAGEALAMAVERN